MPGRARPISSVHVLVAARLRGLRWRTRRERWAATSCLENRRRPLISGTPNKTKTVDTRRNHDLQGGVKPRRKGGARHRYMSAE